MGGIKVLRYHRLTKETNRIGLVLVGGIDKVRFLC